MSTNEHQTEVHDHSFRIFPRTAINSAALGIEYTKPAIQSVRVWAAIQHWSFHKVSGNKYQLSISGYPFVGAHDDRVSASVHKQDAQEWEVTYHERQDAYTITLANDKTKAWTTPTALELTDRIKLAPLNPDLVPRQLFQLKRDD